jgi:hypothetical protein
MSIGVSQQRPTTSLMTLLARQPVAGPVPAIAYDETRQVSRVLEGGTWVDSWEAETLNGTKKFDIETGEDAKGR